MRRRKKGGEKRKRTRGLHARTHGTSYVVKSDDVKVAFHKHHFPISVMIKEKRKEEKRGKRRKEEKIV